MTSTGNVYFPLSLTWALRLAFEVVRAEPSKIAGDAFDLPIAVASRVGSIAAVNLLRRRRRMASLPPLRSFGQSAFGFSCEDALAASIAGAIPLTFFFFFHHDRPGLAFVAIVIPPI